MKLERVKYHNAASDISLWKEGGMKRRNLSKYQQDPLFQIDALNYSQHRSQLYLCIPHALNEEYQ